MQKVERSRKPEPSRAGQALSSRLAPFGVPFWCKYQRIRTVANPVQQPEAVFSPRLTQPERALHRLFEKLARLLQSSTLRTARR